MPLLADGPKSCDQLGYDPRVAQRGLDLLWKYGYVRKRTRPAAPGRCAVQFWMLPGVDLEVTAERGQVDQSLFEACARAVEALSQNARSSL